MLIDLTDSEIENLLWCAKQQFYSYNSKLLSRPDLASNIRVSLQNKADTFSSIMNKLERTN